MSHLGKQVLRRSGTPQEQVWAARIEPVRSNRRLSRMLHLQGCHSASPAGTVCGAQQAKECTASLLLDEADLCCLLHSVHL